MWNRRTRSLLLLTAASASACTEQAPALQQFGGRTMGSTYEVKFVGGMPLATVRKTVETELEAFDLAFSQWRDDSEIMRVNGHASTAPLPVSVLFADVLQQALDIAAATEGAFDPTVKPLSDLFRAAKQKAPPVLDPAALANAASRVDYRRVTVRDGAIHKARPDVQLDLDGIVAGAAAESIAVRLTALGVGSFYLEITGEVLCRGEKQSGVPWRIGVVDPSSDVVGGDVPVRSVPLVDRSLCTSGDYRNGFVVDGKLVHHVFDPRTRQNPQQIVVSASVLASDAAVADALGTALLVLGPETTRRLWPNWRRLGVVGALMLVPADGGSLQAVEIDWPNDSTAGG